MAEKMTVAITRAMTISINVKPSAPRAVARAYAVS